MPEAHRSFQDTVLNLKGPDPEHREVCRQLQDGLPRGHKPTCDIRCSCHCGTQDNGGCIFDYIGCNGCVQNYITAMDSLKLNMVTVDQVHPLLSDLSASLNKLSILPPDFKGKMKMKEWISRMAKMGASDELTEQ